MSRREYRPDSVPRKRTSTSPGVCIWFTGLPCSGKTTTARALASCLAEWAPSVLDGDAVRAQLSPGLGFSKRDRDANVRRLGSMAAEDVRRGAVVIVAAVSPYRATRDEVRELVGRDRFVEVFVDTPVGICEQRDVKGMWVRARRGELQHFTGVDDPYEPPLAPAVWLNTLSQTAEENARTIVGYLDDRGLL